MRSVRSRTFFEQMKGRGTRVITPDDLQAVTPDAKASQNQTILGLTPAQMTLLMLAIFAHESNIQQFRSFSGKRQ
ncbi:MAG: hypothetical protein WA463_14360 [Terriglobales bacterium]